jgi:predicted negative regulator of RcsB-dependent stress response
MNMHISDDEQVEALKKWWKENGTAVVVGVVLGLTLVVGFWKWRDFRENLAFEASDKYVQFTEALAEKNSEQMNEHYQTLISEYSGTTYAVLAAMQMSRQAVEKNDLEKASSELNWALKHVNQDAMTHLVRVRLARVLLAQNKPDEVLTLLAGLKPSAFDAEYAEIRGDVYRQKGNVTEARKEYEMALSSTLYSGKRRDYVKMKMSDLGAVAN